MKLGLNGRQSQGRRSVQRQIKSRKLHQHKHCRGTFLPQSSNREQEPRAGLNTRCGWRPQVRLFRVTEAYQCPQGLDIMSLLPFLPQGAIAVCDWNVVSCSLSELVVFFPSYPQSQEDLYHSHLCMRGEKKQPLFFFYSNASFWRLYDFIPLLGDFSKIITQIQPLAMHTPYWMVCLHQTPQYLFSIHFILQGV